MKLIFKFCLLLSFLFAFASCCRKDMIYSESYQNGYYRNYEHQSAIIKCFNIASTDELASFPYQPESYDQSLNIENSSIPTLKQSVFVRFTTITNLSLSKLNISIILPGAFNGLSNLKTMDLSHNQLTELSIGVYNSLQLLQFLKLNDNKIHTIDERAFMGADSLIEVILKNNHLESLERDVFQSQTKLTVLDVSSNPLNNYSVVHSSKLDRLILSDTNLTQSGDWSNLTINSLELSSCKITVVDFASFPQLKDVNLSGNDIVSVKNCDQLRIARVNLDKNRLDEIEERCSGLIEFSANHNQIQVLRNELFNNSESLTKLEFSFNRISTIEDNVFRGLTSLIYLYLDHNNISEIQSDLFHDLYELQYLSLANNRIANFKFGTFDSLANVTHLNISNNRLLHLNEYIFIEMPRIYNFDFSHNQISTFNTQNFMNHLTYLRYVSLDGNPWQCETLVDVVERFRERATVSLGNDFKVENFQGIACHHGNESPNSETGDNFKKSKFFQFFDKGFMKSKFVKYFDNFKRDESVEADTERLVSSHDSESYNLYNSTLIFNAMLQVLIVAILLLGFYFIVDYLKKSNSNKIIEA